MSDAVITVILTQVAAIMEQQIRQEIRLVCGVGKEFKKLKSEFECIKAVIVDAEKRQVKEELVKVWLEKLKDVSYDTEDVLSEWTTAMQRAEMEVGDDGPHSSRSRKVTSFFTIPCFGFEGVSLRRDIAIKIKRINQRLVEIADEKDKYKFDEVLSDVCVDRPKTASFIDGCDVEGRDADRNNLIGRLLLCGENQEKGVNLNVVSIVGLSGIGKTTLAQLVYSCDEVVNHFDRAMWVCASDPFDEVRIAKAILEVIEGSAPYLFELETLVTKIRNYVEGERFLLVLDDVWTEDFRKWEQLFKSLKTGKVGSTILVTTRKESVARIMGSSYLLRLGRLSVLDSWTLFEKIAFFERKKDECERLEEVGRKIAEKCKGLPLAIKTIGSLMRFKNTLSEWEDVLSSEFWELEEAEGLFPPLMLSYYDLPSNVKRCFTFCAFFPKDHVIEASNLIQLWMAQGYLTSTSTENASVEVEARGQDYLQTLAMRSFFQDVVRERRNGERILSVKMHDMVHDFAHYLTKNECSVVEFNSDFQRKMESSHKRARHLTVVRGEDNQSFPNVPNVEKLFTLWIQSFYDSPPIISKLDRVDPDFIRRLSSLRALDFSQNRIGELPKEIGNLIKVKYLNISHNPFWELPETLCDLYNLQTLKLSACDHLRRLPSRIYKLSNLRHLEIDRTNSLKMLPKGIADLASLQTLNKFIIISVNDRSNAACGLAELKNLNNLRGCLKIEGLGFAADADEAKRAELMKKINLSDLEMDFSPLIKNASQDAVIEALEAPENLQSLQITSYGGTKLPKWIMKLDKLQQLFLQDCQDCAVFPPLDRLPLLVTLHLEGLNGIKCLALESLGSRVSNEDSMANGGSATSGFPNLKKLKISKMESWEEWDVMSSMPRLRCLKISHCNKVKAVPPLLLHSSPLRKLRIDNCRLLHQLYNKGSGELWNEISHISKIRVS